MGRRSGVGEDKGENARGVQMGLLPCRKEEQEGEGEWWNYNWNHQGEGGRKRDGGGVEKKRDGEEGDQAGKGKGANSHGVQQIYEGDKESMGRDGGRREGGVYNNGRRLQRESGGRGRKAGDMGRGEGARVEG
ncbi:protein qua-1-like [Onthophagus taurus]|uniref:protein qua-1-like n=1 Tax=Onthophagus taurus TaxID=166361 RepID=UPI0039BE166D